jgi:hypothetical protein
VSAVLFDRPDPGADPIGCALAQTRPLRAVHTAKQDPPLRAINGLASADQAFYASNGSKVENSRVPAASTELDKFCPEVSS